MCIQSTTKGAWCAHTLIWSLETRTHFCQMCIPDGSRYPETTAERAGGIGKAPSLAGRTWKKKVFMDRPTRQETLWLRTRAEESGCHPQGLQRGLDAEALLTTLTSSLAHLFCASHWTIWQETLHPMPASPFPAYIALNPETVRRQDLQNTLPLPWLAKTWSWGASGRGREWRGWERREVSDGGADTKGQRKRGRKITSCETKISLTPGDKATNLREICELLSLSLIEKLANKQAKTSKNMEGRSTTIKSLDQKYTQRLLYPMTGTGAFFSSRHKYL